ncbi:single-stranded DNA-binding protein [Carboxydochorda subterranea]|uniref:Single-stranded DNA-binding protein n=1 Tax=Carboxydichorda subterranea TaxID=3109565 RepID=A0ABZ1BWN1_9FIRM|nr:single-stranded DNA-binding protein [Limnochorda sp. L945t]WRP17084.1 single-stranded DNA-binding protein [Limnochorda sp. L945t]
MVNRIVLVGRAVKDAELRYTGAGAAVTRFRIAVDRPFTNQQGQRETDFIDVVCWRKLAETVGAYVRKGRLVGVDGRLQIRSYDDQNGIRRIAAEVVADRVAFLEPRPKGTDEGGPTPEAGDEFAGEGAEDLPAADETPF